MKKLFPITLIAILVLSLFLASGFSSATAKATNILEFGSMTGVPRPYTGATNAIRMVPGGGLPWVVGSAVGELKSNGNLEIVVMGLVIDPNDPAAISRGLAGTNPSPNFKAIVSCLSRDASGNPTTENRSTGLFPASPTGDARIEATLSLPQPCIAPIIFVTSPTGSWFAATGF
ncbi:MAG TPA: hypothetical protein VGK00_03495 [Anaerolineales bacterium]|jgi:hypothetical protein